jgi:hypothetical protein
MDVVISYKYENTYCIFPLMKLTCLHKQGGVASPNQAHLVVAHKQKAQHGGEKCAKQGNDKGRPCHILRDQASAHIVCEENEARELVKALSVTCAHSRSV